MRKEDRIRQQQNQDPSQQQPDRPEPRPTERVKGGGSGDDQYRPPQRIVPLPD
jgi:hypothetical protein